MDHVIIGQGPAGIIAAETLREQDAMATISVIGDEGFEPYSRMALPYLLNGRIGEPGTLLRADNNHFRSLGIDLVAGRVKRVHGSSVVLDTGDNITFDRLLIAAGGHAARPPIRGIDLAGIENCWTIKDARRIAKRATKGAQVLIMGAGFIGCIVLEALAKRSAKITIAEAHDRMLPNMMDETGGEMIANWCRGKGIDVKTGTHVEELIEYKGKIRGRFSNGNDRVFDLVICATGVKPNIGLLDGSEIKTETGILVDHYMQTSRTNIFAAGDIAQGPDFFTGKQVVHAIQPTASEHGRIAGLNMAGRKTRYQGSLAMNVLSTLGLVSMSYGRWQGVDGRDQVARSNEHRFSYIRLAFKDDVLIGALTLGFPAHGGVLRGLIQSRIRLGKWKEKLLDDPALVMQAWLATTHGPSANLFPVSA